MGPNTSNLCTLCNKSNALLCNRCKSACYCSKVCQKADWPTHRLLCATYSAFNTSTRPSNEHVRAILFPADEKKPKVVWLNCPWDVLGEFQCPQIAKFLGCDAVPGVSIQRNQLLKRDLLDTVYVSHRDYFIGDGSESNESIGSIFATKRGRFYDWRGPIIAYGTVGLGTDQRCCRDLEMNDFRHIVDFFLWYGFKPLSTTEQHHSVKVQGVRINCVGDQKMLKKPKFEAVSISSANSIFSKHDTSDIADRIGLPIFTQKCTPNPKWVDDDHNPILEHQHPFDNQDATFLHLCCEPKADFDLNTGVIGWGYASRYWLNSVGSIIVVREDKKPLSLLDAEALCEYVREDLQPLFAHSIGEYSPEEPLSKELVLAMICRPTFYIRWCKLKGKKIKDGEDSIAPNPYTI